MPRLSIIPASKDFVELLSRRVRRHPDRLAHVFLRDGENEAARLTYAELDQRARGLAVALLDRYAAGERAVLLFPSGADFIVAFLGCLYAGMVAVPCSPPSRGKRGHSRLRGILRDAAPRVVMSDTATRSRSEVLRHQIPELAGPDWLDVEELDGELGATWRKPRIGGETLAFLQYTSGSTSAPRGVRVRHRDLLANEEMIRQAFAQTADSVIVGWLPVFHDMGLIGNVLQPLYVGARSILMPPTAFLRRPGRWLETISHYRGTTSGGPNFAYDLAVRSIPPERRATLDLASWQVAFNGAEPIRAATLERFAAAFEPCGFQKRAFFPCYGLAEATLFVTGRATGAVPVVEEFGVEDLERHGRAVAAPGEVATRRLVGCGHTRPGLEVRIVDPDTCRRLPSGRVGEIWIHGESVADGYRNQPGHGDFVARLVEVPEEGPFLRTGDLGFEHSGELFVTGRLKDLIIIRGRNYYPQDIERAVEESHPGLRPGGAAAFSVDQDGEERLVVVQELERRALSGDTGDLVAAVRRAVSETFELGVHAVVLVRPASLPKTSSGKIQRYRCRQAWLEGSLAEVCRHVAAEASPEDEVLQAGEEALDLETLLAASGDTRRELLAGDLRRCAARLLRLPAAEIAGDRPLGSYGLDSLTAIGLGNEVERRFGVELPWVDLLAGAGLDELCGRVLERLERAEEAGAGDSSSPSAGLADDQLLSAGQEALWLLYRMAPESPAYNLAFAVRVRGPLDVEALRRAAGELGERHAMLRATFSSVSGRPVQRIAAGAEIDFAVDTAESGEDAWHRELARPFDLETGPPWRLRVWRRGPEEHVLVLALHHIVSDFWSLELLADELRRAYVAALRGESWIPELPEATYPEFAGWQRSMLGGTRGRELREFWLEQLAGAPDALELPADRPRPPAWSDRGAALPVRIDGGLTERLEARARQAGCTLYVLLLAAWQVLLSRASGQLDLLVGSPAAGREGARWARVQGYFVNPLALRGDLSGDPSFEAFLGSSRSTVLAALAHQEYPLSVLVDELRPRRDPSRSPLFQVMFTFQKERRQEGAGLLPFALGRSGARLDWAGLELESLASEERSVQFDLALTMARLATGLEGSLEWSLELFDATTARRHASHFGRLLAAIAGDPGRRLSSLRVLSAAEAHQMLCEWQAPVATHEAGPVHALVFETAGRAPDRLAVAGPDGTLSYGELCRRAASLAGLLIERGLAVEDRVALVLEPGCDAMVAALGVLAAGGAYVPLDPEAPRQRLAELLGENGVSAVVTRGELAARLPADGPEPVLLDRPLPAAGAARLRGGQRTAACVVSTSGSTGRPKGVVLEHRGLSILIASFLESYGVTADDRVLPLTAPTSASFVGEIWPVLCGGGGLVMPAREDVLTFGDLPRLIARHRVTLTSTVPSLAAKLDSRAGELGSLRWLLVGGEELRAHDVRRLSRSTRVVNGYGLSEATICSCVHRVSARDAGTSSALPVGRPLRGHALYVLDRYLAPQPVGFAGELCVSESGLARGYLGRGGATAFRWVPHPFAEGERLLRTGDRARWRCDGELDYLGRLDRQIKIRGHRIEPGAVEAALGSHPAIAAVAVEPRPGAGAGRHEWQLVAYFVTRPGRQVEAGELRSFLAGRLPAYMTPGSFQRLDELPLTPNGKIDRRSLPAPRRRGPAGAAPGGRLERDIARHWREILGLERVGVDDNFFDLGGNSLRMAEVHDRLRQEVSRDLALVDLFRYPTIGTLASFLKSSSKPSSRHRAVAGQRAERRRGSLAARQLAARRATAAALRKSPTPSLREPR